MNKGAHSAQQLPDLFEDDPEHRVGWDRAEDARRPTPEESLDARFRVQCPNTHHM